MLPILFPNNLKPLTIEPDYSNRLSKLRLVDATALKIDSTMQENSSTSFHSLVLTSLECYDSAYKFPSGMSHVTSIGLEGCHITNPGHVVLDRLERLAFYDSRCEDVYHTFKEFGDGLPKLREVELSCIHNESFDDSERENSGIVMPCNGIDRDLEVLKIRMSPLDLVHSIFFQWKMPKLKTLKLVHVDDVEAQDLLWDMEDAFNELVSLHGEALHQVPHSISKELFAVQHFHFHRVLRAIHTPCNVSSTDISDVSRRKPIRVT